VVLVAALVVVDVAGFTAGAGLVAAAGCWALASVITSNKLKMVIILFIIVDLAFKNRLFF